MVSSKWLIESGRCGVHLESDGWHKLSASGSGPCARGWFASTLLPTGDLVIHGGLDCSNKRLGDMFILHMHGKGSEA
eukprot:scaffold266976_cov14-Tisochrysis_lutea.AAC.1